ncbi:DUF523 and DUF1722 domain-containing protein [Methanolobus sp. ZRKC3]|uniref:YbgA family protein n=1 Tax=Methanolobus sp. ZRKC3 TaxID=3125786 RepID=UPI003243210F
MRNFTRPIVLVSRCLEFDNVRYDGKVVPCRIVRDLVPLVDFIKVCPEYEIGLGVPRDPIRIVKQKGDYKLIQPKTGEDVTEKMDTFTKDFMKDLADVDGFIFKSRSPTIGVRDIKVYSGAKASPVIEKGMGFFASEIFEKYHGYPIEEDDRLRNYHIRHHFLTQLYTFADFRAHCGSASIDKLEEFNEKNRFLFTYYDASVYGQMCELLKSCDSAISPEEVESTVFKSYASLLKQVLSKPGDVDSKVSVSRQIFSNFKHLVPESEHIFFEQLIENFSLNRITDDALIEVLRLYVLRFDEDNIDNYTLLYPYPEILRISGDEKRDKDYWDNGE